MESKEKINFNEFLEITNKLEIKVGKITSATRIPKKDKLLELNVRFGVNTEDFRTCVTNLGETFEPEDFIGNSLPFITNLEPAKMGGVVSEVMLMVSKNENNLDIDMNEFRSGGSLM